MRKIYLSSAFLLCLISNPLWAQDNPDTMAQGYKVMSLQEIIAAVGNNPALKAIDEKISSYGAYAESAMSWEAPKITGGLWMVPYNIRDNKNMGALMIGAEQMIPNPSRQKAGLNYMRGMASVDEAMRNYDLQDMVEEARKIYYEWIILKKKQKILKESEELISLMIKSAEIGYTYNQNSLSRIYKAKSELYNLQNMRLMIGDEIAQKNIRLNTLMNIRKDIVYDIDTTYTIADYDMLPVDTLALQQNRSDIRSIDQSIRLYGLKRELELSKRKPDFGIQYAHMNGLGMMPNQFSLMGMVTIPIVPWAGRDYKASLKGLDFETRSLTQKRLAIINEAAGDLQRLRLSIRTKKKQAEMYEKNIIPVLEKNFRSSLIAFEHMKEDMFMTIDAWQALRTARIQHLDIIGELLKMQAEYERQTEK